MTEFKKGDKVKEILNNTEGIIDEILLYSFSKKKRYAIKIPTGAYLWRWEDEIKRKENQNGKSI